MNKKQTDRKINILKIIVEHYIQTGEVSGSKSLLKKHNIGVSPATIRNDMADLEKMGLIFQAYNSAWRLPTTRGLRVFVDYLMETMPTHFIEWQKRFEQRQQQERIDDRLFGLVSGLTKTTKEITFACVPDQAKSYYLGLSNFLQKNLPILGDETYNVIRVLENKYNFIDLLQDLDISPKVSVFIGEENIIPDLESCTMIVKKIDLEGVSGYLGILASLRCDYAFNIAALRHIFSQ